MTLSSIFKSFLTFRFSILVGLIMGIWIYSSQSEQQPVSSFLTGIPIYLIAFLILFGFRLIIWVVIEKGALYSLKSTLGNIIVDYISCIAMLLSVIGCLFLIHAFIL